MNPVRNRSSIIYLLLFVAIIALVVVNFQQETTSTSVVAINEVVQKIQTRQVERIVQEENRLTVILKDGSELTSTIDINATLVEQLKDLGATTEQLSV